VPHLAKQDKELAQFAPTPLRQGRQWANPHDDSITQKGGKNINTATLASVDFYPVIQPILEILDAILWPTIAVVVGIGTIYCVFLGVKISKADEQNSREKAKKDLVGAIIGFVIIFVLILALKIAVPILENWVKAQM